MSKIIAFANHKGGVSKTTSVANIGAILSQRGKKVLLIDLDAQANLTDYFLKERPEGTIYDALVNDTPLPVVEIGKGLSIVPSSLDMVGLETRIADNIDRAELLQIALEPLREEYDYILVDCPPSLGIVTLNALIAATDLYIPLTAEAIPVRGLKMLTDALERVKRRKNPNIELSGIIITRWGGRNLNRLIEESLRKNFGEVVFKTKIRENISIAEAPTFYQDIVTYAPSSHGAEDYLALTEEVLKRTK
jgi:chromosome partitioning protein